MTYVVRSELTFLCRLTEDGVMVIDGHQSNVVVVDDVLRVFEAVVSAYEAINCRWLLVAELVHQKNVEDLC